MNTCGRTYIHTYIHTSVHLHHTNIYLPIHSIHGQFFFFKSGLEINFIGRQYNVIEN